MITGRASPGVGGESGFKETLLSQGKEEARNSELLKVRELIPEGRFSQWCMIFC